MAAIDELENRVRELSSEVEGEKMVTRQVYAQAVRNSDQLLALRSEIVALTARTDHVASEVVQGSAMLRGHGARLDSLTRDIGLLRNDATELRRGQEAINARLDTMDHRLDTMDHRLDTMDHRLDSMDHRLDSMDHRLDSMDRRLDAMDRRLDTMDRNITAILVAVVPPNPPPAGA